MLIVRVAAKFPLPSVDPSFELIDEHTTLS